MSIDISRVDPVTGLTMWELDRDTVPVEKCNNDNCRNWRRVKDVKENSAFYLRNQGVILDISFKISNRRLEQCVRMLERKPDMCKC
jgi:hypothetical protein